MNKKKSSDEIEVNVREFARKIVDEPTCLNTHSKRYSRCSCLKVIGNDEGSFDNLVYLLLRFAIFNTKERQLFLHGVLTHAFIAKESIARGQKKTEPTFVLNSIRPNGEDAADPVRICHNAMRNLFAIGQKQWTKLRNDAALPSPKNLQNYKKMITENSKILKV